MDGAEPQGRKSWTTSEVRCLLEQAGKRPLSDICAELGRTEASIKSKAAELRRSGQKVSLRFYESELVWCPNCATWRTKVFRATGMCLVCRLKKRVGRAERKCEEALAALPDETRAEFLSKQHKRGSAVPLKPKVVPPTGNTPYETMKFQADSATAIELWEVACLRKMANAEKTRLSRIRRKADKVPHVVAEERSQPECTGSQRAFVRNPPIGYEPLSLVDDQHS